MLMRNITLPTGPYDWDELRMPAAVGAARLARLRGLCADRGLAGLVVSGSTFDDGALAWATGFTPKLGPAFALLARDGTARILFSGGPGMKPSAEKLTWLADVAALRNLSVDCASFAAEHPGRWAICGNEGLSHRDHAALSAAFPDIEDVTSIVAGFRREAEVPSRALLAPAIHVLGDVESHLRQACAAGGSRFAAALAAETLARRAGAQDLRLRISSREGGPAEPVDPGPSRMPAFAYFAIALRMNGHWLCAYSLSREAVPELSALWQVLRPQLRAGARVGIFEEDPAIRVLLHPVGYSIVEPALASEACLRAGDVVCVTLQAGPDRASAMVEITPDGARTMWLSSAVSGERS